MSTLALRGVKKSYAAVQVLHSVDMEVQEGEFVVLVGPSGCGKSTMLRMIAGLEEVTEGEIRIDGRVVNNDTPKQRNIAMVFQNYALYPHMTVRQNIGINLEIAGVGKQDVERRVRAAAELLGIEDYLDRRPAQLSGGQRQRVAMGRAIVRDPAVFLFDEPLSNLDAKLRVQMRSEIKALQTKMPRTSIYVTHDQTEAMTLGDRVAVLRKGELQQVASPRGLYEQPVNLFVAGFIGSPPMNFLPGEVSGSSLRLPFAQVPLSDELRERIGSRDVVIVGLRPEHFADAGLLEDHKRTAGVTFDAEVDVTEWLGSDLYAYVPFETSDAVAATLEELDRDLDGEGMRTQLVVALDSESRIRDGDTAQLWFDPARLLVFDPESGENLTFDAERAAEIDAQNEADRKASLERAQERERKAAAAGG